MRDEGGGIEQRGTGAARLRRARRAADLRMALRGARGAILLPAWVVGFAMLGVGALAREIGVPFLPTVLSTPLIWAGPAQFVLFGSFAAGAAALSIALAVSLTSMRLLPMGLTLLPLMRREGQGLGLRLLLAHFVVVTTWVEGLRRLPGLPPRERAAYFLGFAATCVAVSTGLTAAGYLMSGRLPLPLAAALLFLTPIFFVLSLIATAEGVADRAALVLGVALAPLATWAVGPDFDLLAVGLLGGSAAYALGRWRRR